MVENDHDKKNNTGAKRVTFPAGQLTEKFQEKTYLGFEGTRDQVMNALSKQGNESIIQTNVVAASTAISEQEKKKKERQALNHMLLDAEQYRNNAIDGLKGEIDKRRKQIEDNKKEFLALEAREAKLKNINNQIENKTFKKDSAEGKAALEDAGVNDVSEIPDALKLIRDTKAALQEKNVMLGKEIVAQEKAIVELRKLKNPSIKDINKVLTDNGQEKLKGGQTLGEVKRELKIDNMKDMKLKDNNTTMLEVDEQEVSQFMQDQALYNKNALTKESLHGKIKELSNETKQFLSKTSPEAKTLLEQAAKEMAAEQSRSEHLNGAPKELINGFNAPQIPN